MVCLICRNEVIVDGILYPWNPECLSRTLRSMQAVILWPRFNRDAQKSCKILDLVIPLVEILCRSPSLFGLLPRDLPADDKNKAFETLM